MQRLDIFVWKRLQRSLVFFWGVLLAISLVAYVAFLLWLRNDQLQSSLNIAKFTVEEAMRAGDWDLALGHLESVIKASNTYGIELWTRSDPIKIAGPIGEPNLGVGSWCLKSKTESQDEYIMNGCVRILGYSEIFTLALFGFLISGFFLFTLVLLRSKTLTMVSAIAADLDNMKDSDLGSGTKTSPLESRHSILEVQAVRERIYNLVLEVKKTSQQIALAELAAQVAHDIRSPLAAIDMAEKEFVVLPEEIRTLLRSAISRIRDIANDLIDKNRKVHSLSAPIDQDISTQEPIDSHLLSSLIETVITEKRMQFRAQLGVEILFQVNEKNYGLFINTQLNEFKRVLSNLINNAIEAICGRGTVTVQLFEAGNKIKVCVCDSGKGISPELIDKLSKKGATFGKEGGSGLGLYHAKTSCEAWHGELELKSELGNGTQVVLSFPKSEAPFWFVKNITVPLSCKIGVLDDDQSIHQIWTHRFEQLYGKDGLDEHLFHFSSPAELRKWFSSNLASKDFLFLLDYELIGFSENGLDLIEELELSDRCILVTSRYESLEIIAKCFQLGVRIIPKKMAAFTPLLIEVRESWDAILLDDDILIHMTWKLAAKSFGKKIRLFTKPEELLRESHLFDYETPIYIDQHLDEGKKGQDIVEQLVNLGFTELYLATGNDPGSMRPVPGLRAVRGKDAPWVS